MQVIFFIRPRAYAVSHISPSCGLRSLIGANAADMNNNHLENLRRNAELEQASYYFGLLSEPTRLKILSSLCGGEHPVNTIVASTGTTQANVSRQLNILYRSKFLARRKEGTQVFYRINDERMIALCNMICRNKAIALLSQASGRTHDTCRQADMNCGIDGTACRWQLAGASA